GARRAWRRPGDRELRPPAARAALRHDAPHLPAPRPADLRARRAARRGRAELGRALGPLPLAAGMKPRTAIEVVATPDGGELVLWRRDDVYEIQVDGLELMSSRAHGSEEELARLTCTGLPRAPRVLIGGLGFGFTARAALDALPQDARVTVAEFFSAVVAWNRERVGHLARHPLADPRLHVEVGDVQEIIA